MQMWCGQQALSSSPQGVLLDRELVHFIVLRFRPQTAGRYLENCKLLLDLLNGLFDLMQSLLHT